jgi:hypothetical protein
MKELIKAMRDAELSVGSKLQAIAYAREIDFPAQCLHASTLKAIHTAINLRGQMEAALATVSEEEQSKLVKEVLK